MDTMTPATVKTPAATTVPPGTGANSRTDTHATIAMFPTHAAAEDAVRALQRAGIDMTMLSIVGKGYHTEDHVVGYYTTGDRMKTWGSVGLFWGGMWGLLVGAALFLIPGVGPVLVAGPLVVTLAAGLEGAAVGGSIGVVGAGLASLGVPPERALAYDTAVRAGKFLLVATGPESEVQRARGIIDENSREAAERAGTV